MVILRRLGYALALLLAIVLLLRLGTQPSSGEDLEKMAGELTELQAEVNALAPDDAMEKIRDLREIVAELTYEVNRLAELIPSSVAVADDAMAQTPAGRWRQGRLDGDFTRFDREEESERDPNAPPRYGTEEWRREMERLTNEARTAQIDFVAEKFELDDAQKDDLLEILRLEVGRSQAVHTRVKAHEMTIKGMRLELKRIRAERDDALREVLSEEKFLEYKKMFPDPPDPLADRDEEDDAGGDRKER